MKLDTILLYEAAAAMDAETIVSIFAGRFQGVRDRANRQWEFRPASWQTADIRLRTPVGSYSILSGEYFLDSGIYSYDGAHVIMLGPRFLVKGN